MLIPTGTAQAGGKTLFEVIIESDTPAGNWFDILLILSILNCMMSLRDTIKCTWLGMSVSSYENEFFFLTDISSSNVLFRIPNV